MEQASAEQTNQPDQAMLDPSSAPAHNQHDQATPDLNAADQNAATRHELIQNALDVILPSQDAPSAVHTGLASPLPQPPALANPGPLGAGTAPADNLLVLGQDAPAVEHADPAFPSSIHQCSARWVPTRLLQTTT
jgi:hypothetical protein